MTLEIILLIAAVIVAWLALTWFLKVAQASLKTAIVIVLILLALQLTFGVGPKDLVPPLMQVPRMIQQFFQDRFGSGGVGIVLQPSSFKRELSLLVIGKF